MYSQYASSYLNRPSSSTTQYYKANPSTQFRSYDQSLRPTFSPINQRFKNQNQSKMPNFTEYTPSSYQRPKINSLSPGYDQPYTRSYTPSYQGAYNIHTSPLSKQGYTPDIGLNYGKSPLDLGQRGQKFKTEYLRTDPYKSGGNYVPTYMSSKPTLLRQQNQSFLNKYGKYNYSTTSSKDQSNIYNSAGYGSVGGSNLGYKQMKLQKQPYFRGYGQTSYGNKIQIGNRDMKYKNNGYGYGSGGYGGLNPYQRGLDRNSGYKQVERGYGGRDYNHLKY